MSELAGQAVVTEPAPETITVQLANSRLIRGRAHWPGDYVTLPEAEARELLQQGLAVRA